MGAPAKVPPPLSRASARRAILRRLPDDGGKLGPTNFLEGESEAQVKRSEVVIFAWGWVDSVVDANRPDGQVVT